MSFAKGTFFVRDRAWFMRLSSGIIDHTGAQTMLYLTCTMISSVDLAHYRVSRAKDRVSVHCGTITNSACINLYFMKC